MLRLTRNLSKRPSVLLIRGLAEVIPAKASVSKNSKATAQILEQGRVPVKEDHGLWAFFRKKKGDGLVGEAQYETIEHTETVRMAYASRAWRVAELRLKSFEDLHILWYVLLRERNLLATQMAEARRLHISEPGAQVYLPRLAQCRKAMARIKMVLNERRLAYEGAMKLIEKQHRRDEDAVVLEYQQQQHEEERKRVLSRRELTERRREAWLKSKESQQEEIGSAPTEDIQAEKTARASTEDIQAKETARASTADAQVQVNMSVEAHAGADMAQAQSGETAPQPSEPTEAPSEDIKVVVERSTKVQRKSPSNPAAAAADALFGGGRR